MKNGLAVVIMAVLSILICAAKPVSLRAAPGGVSPEERKKQLEEMQKVVAGVCDPIKPFFERPDKIKNIMIDDVNEINAYAEMGGDIHFFVGMLDFVRDKNELAVVCAHEMTHISGQHIKRSIGTQILAGVASVAIGGTAGDYAGAALASKQSRKHEREADARGLLFMWQAGYDPRAAWKFWASMKAANGGDGGKIMKYLGSHPVDDERVENNKVLLVRYCRETPSLPYCDEILLDQDLLQAYNNFEER